MKGKWYLNPMNIFGIFMVLAYVAFGIYILCAADKFAIPSEAKTIFGIFLIIYGIFRAARIYTKNQNPES
jgi:hypothetical protein